MQHEAREDGPRGLGEFQRRLNRDRDHRHWGREVENGDRRNGWGGETPRSDRGGRDSAPSVRVPNLGWESTPRRGQGGDGSAWRNRRWDAPTPRVARGGSPDDGDAALGIDFREWEEEQVRLDRDWYTGAEEGGVAGDEENNPLAHYEDLSVLKEAEKATKQVVSCHSLVLTLRTCHANIFFQKKISARQAQYVSPPLYSFTNVLTLSLECRQ